MNKRFLASAAIFALIFTNSIFLQNASAAPEAPSAVKPADFSESVGLSPSLEALVKDSSGKAIQTVEFKEGFTYDAASVNGLKAFQKTTVNDPIFDDTAGEVIPFSGNEMEDVAFDDGESIITKSANAFPSHRFEVDVSRELTAGSKVELYWKGKTLARGIINLSAWNYHTGKWQILKQAEGSSQEEEIELVAEVSQAEFTSDGKIQAMVHVSGAVMEDVEEPEAPFTMLWFTDTQYYAQDYPEIWESMTDWMIAEYNKGTYEYAFHTGDLVQVADAEEQWAVADENLTRMDEANIPYGVLAGNHDVIQSGDSYDYSNYWKYVGADRFKDNSWYGGQMDNNRNHFDLFSFGEHDFIMLYLGFGTEGTPETIEWANNVLRKHSDRNAILSIHNNINANAQYVYEGARIVNERIVVPNENIKMVISGHYPGATRRVLNLKNADGSDREVLEVLSNYQGSILEDRGQGYLRLLTFDPSVETLSVITYSPPLDDTTFYGNGRDKFTVDFDLIDIESTNIEKQVETDYMAINIYKDLEIGRNNNLKSGATASVQWKNLNEFTQYFWYMNLINDSGEANRSEIYRFTTGEALEPPQTPAVNEIADNSTSVTGTAEPKMIITVKEGSTILGIGNASLDGKYEISISKQKAETKITVTATNAEGIESEAREVTVADRTAPTIPTVNKVTEQSVSVTGMAEKGSAVTVKVGSTQLGKGQANSAGNFSVPIPKQRAGTKISVTATDTTGNTSGVKEVTVVDETAPAIPAVNKVTNHSVNVTGAAEKGATLAINSGSKQIGVGLVNDEGKFSVSIPKQKAGTKLLIIASDKAGNKSKALEIKVIGENYRETNISRLGHLKRESVRIYGYYGDQNDYNNAGAARTQQVYYIKKEARYTDGLYYLISQSPSSTRGVVGWVKATDLSTHSHVGMDRKAKTLYLKGNGSAYTKAWGGQKNLVFENLTDLKGKVLAVNLTEKVGGNTWYRGVLNGKTVWIHEAYLSVKPLFTENSTSRLGHLKSESVRIYGYYGNQKDYVSAGAARTQQVYYIKKEARYTDGLYYLISQSPSSTRGVVGWVKATDLSTHSHVGMDRKAKTLYLKGNGSAYTKAWGGQKNLVFESLTDLKGKVLAVNLTEKVGGNTWYRGVLNGKTVWIHEAYLSK